MTKELEALERIGAEKLARGELIRNDDRLEPYITILKQALQRLEAIDNAKPSEALIYTNVLIEENDHDIENQNITGFDIFTQAKWVKYLNDKSSLLNTIKNTLLKAQEQEKVLEIIFEKDVDMIELGCAEYYYQYNKEVYEKYHDDDMLLTQEEFDTLKRYFENES
jgi:hypothetical protein